MSDYAILIAFVLGLVGTVTTIFIFKRRLEHGPWHFQCYIPGIALVLMAILLVSNRGWSQPMHNIFWCGFLGVVAVADAALGGKSWCNGRLYISGFGLMLVSLRLMLDYLRSGQ